MSSGEIASSVADPLDSFSGSGERKRLFLGGGMWGNICAEPVEMNLKMGH